MVQLQAYDQWWKCDRDFGHNKRKIIRNIKDTYNCKRENLIPKGNRKHKLNQRRITEKVKLMENFHCRSHWKFPFGLFYQLLKLDYKASWTNKFKTQLTDMLEYQWLPQIFSLWSTFPIPPPSPFPKIKAIGKYFYNFRDSALLELIFACQSSAVFSGSFHIYHFNVVYQLVTNT